MMALGVTVKLFDQMSGGMGRIVQQVDGLRGKLQKLSDQASAVGRGALGTGLIAGGTLAKPIAAFAALEDASTRLKSAMMDKNGMTGAFEQVNALAVKLGDRLPGTTADFLNMMAAMKKLGTTDESILGGVGEATAYMAVLFKQTPEQAAEFSVRLKEAMGVADADMLKFMDTIQRTYHQGVDATQMMYAFARSAGALKAVKLQGLEAANGMSALYAMLLKVNPSGETVGTGFAAILSAMQDAEKLGKVNNVLQAQKGFKLEFTDKKGNFLGVENMMAQFDKLKSLDPDKLNLVLKSLFGTGQDAQMVATMISNGTEGYQQMVADMEKQADLKRRIELVLHTLTSLWEAAIGTFTNLLASVGEAMGEDLKTLTEWFGKLSESVKKMVEANPEAARWMGRIALAFVGLMMGGGTLLILAGGIGKAIIGLKLLVPAALFGVGAFAKLLTVMSAVGAFMLANPITIAVVALALAAGLIYENWGPIKEFFVDLWDGIKSGFTTLVEFVGTTLRSISDMLPEWVTKYTLPGAAIKLAGDALGPDRPNAVTPGGAQQSKVGLDIGVRVDQDGRVTGVTSSANSRDVPLSLDNGLAMVSP